MLLATKLFTPQPHRQMVTRPRLLQAINNGLSGRVILICAPAGSGKTTLIADWLAQQQGRRQSVWLALDEQDNDPVRFLTYLLAAFQRVEATLGAGLQAMLQMAQPPSPEHLLTQLLNELAACPATMALVLDDYHVITTPAIHDLLHFFVDHLSPNVVLVIASRSEPPLPLARWRVRRLLVEVRERALRFTQAETTAFLHQELDTQLAAEDIVALVERTEGWIAGLQLAVLSLQGRQEIAPFLHSFTGSHHYTMDYLTEEVLQRLPRTVEAFLLQTSILARLTASLCDAVTGTTEAQSILLQLERANLFLIPLDQERQWYRYHHLFADVLRKTLAGSYAPPMVAELHQRAGDWFEQHGFISEAVDHALASGDLQRAAVRIESASEDLLNHGQHLTLQRWLQKLPPDTLQTRPRLLLVSAAIASHMHLLAESERALHAAEAAAATLAPGARALLLAEIAVSQASMALNRSDYQQVCRLAQQALATLPEHDQRARGEALFYLGTACALQGNIVQAEQAYARAVPLSKAAGDLRTAILAMSNQSRTLYIRGKLHEAHQIAEATVHFARTAGVEPIPSLAFCYQYLGELWYEWNDLTKAESYARLVIERAQTHQMPRQLAVAYAALARVYQARGDGAAALTTVAQAVQLVQTYNLPARYHELYYEQARLWLAAGDLQAAATWAAGYQLPVIEQQTLLERNNALLTLALIHYSQGELTTALQILEQLTLTMEAVVAVYSALPRLLLQALIRQAQGDVVEAVNAVTEALILAEPGGYIRAFVNLGEPMCQLLVACRAQRAKGPGNAPSVGTRLSTYINRLLAAFPDTAHATPPTTEIHTRLSDNRTLVEPLSEREQEVLRLVAEGRSNSQIADQLIITVGTVKRHLNNIFGKLQVTSRTQALARARELNLL